MAELELELERLRAAILGRDDPLVGERLGVYRRLARAAMNDAIGSILPRTVALLGARLDDELARFYAERGPRTHYLRDVPLELVEHAWRRWRDDPALPPHLADLARLEALELTVAIGDDDDARARPELRLDARAVFRAAVGQVSLAHAVHEDGEPPARRPVSLLVYRDAEHALRTLELTPAAAAIVTRLRAGEPLGIAIEAGAADAGVPVDDALLAGTARFLADLAERGVLLGS